MDFLAFKNGLPKTVEIGSQKRPKMPQKMGPKSTRVLNTVNILVIASMEANLKEYLTVNLK